MALASADNSRRFGIGTKKHHPQGSGASRYHVSLVNFDFEIGLSLV
jgi:hypothetical protein